MNDLSTQPSPAPPAKSPEEVKRVFAENKALTTRAILAAPIALPLILMPFYGLSWLLGGPMGQYVLYAGFGLTVVIVGVVRHKLATCPACGEFFGRRFFGVACPNCGVPLV